MSSLFISGPIVKLFNIKFGNFRFEDFLHISIYFHLLLKSLNLKSKLEPEFQTWDDPTPSKCEKY